MCGKVHDLNMGKGCLSSQVAQSVLTGTKNLHRSILVALQSTLKEETEKGLWAINKVNKA